MAKGQNSTNKPELQEGKPFPFGAYEYPEGMNFAVYIKKADKVSLCLFEEGNTATPLAEYPLSPSTHCTGNVWHALIKGLKAPIIYGIKVDGTILLDPYSKAVASSPKWNDRSIQRPYQPLGKAIGASNFDWQGIKNPRIPEKDLIIYEMHVRGFTQDPSSGVKNPGTFAGLIEKIPYLKELGVNAIELLPIFEFNETEVSWVDPKLKQPLVNYFGYSHVSFFAPMNRYASQSQNDQAIVEFKTMVRELHRNGIEVILDVVYNHTSEGDEKGPTYSFKGLDKKTYYMIDDNGNYLNFSGTGNTYNCNHPIAAEVILNSLRYWVTEMHVDGFRFDLASILTRAENGTPLGSTAPIVEAISKDPILTNTKLIAEAWDAAGLYQVGSFYPGTRWSEWNGRYRDVVRRFIKGTEGHKKAFATAISGSDDIYGWRGSPHCSINFVTAHDGFSLSDLVTYNDKHNLNNGEENRDGFDHNDSWNCGIEGHSCNKKIVALRERQIRNFVLALIMSQGIPMFLMGDEYAHSRDGNNNTWCQDNRLNWFLWDHLDTRPGFLRFVKSMLKLRKSIPLLHRENFLTEKDVTWHGHAPNQPEWDNDNRFIAFTLNVPDKYPELYVAFNAGHTTMTITLPLPGEGRHWEWIVNTHNETPNDYFDEGKRPIAQKMNFLIHSYSSIVLISMPNPKGKEIKMEEDETAAVAF
jgi:isoamylase